MINNNCNCTTGYTPYILNGECRFCYGKQHILETKVNHIFYDNKYIKILTNINNIINNNNKNITNKYS